MYEVAITKIEDNLESAVKNSLDLINWKKYIKRNGTVVIKPNMGNLTYLPGIITNPDILYNVISCIRDHVSEVIIGESDALRYSCDDAFVKTGYKKIVERAGGTVFNFSKDKQVSVAIDGLYLHDVILPKKIVDADSFISMPVLKTHEATILTCALKNQFGCIADKNRILYHHHLHKILADINMAIQPNLIITDGSICMEGNGPIHGPPKELGIIMMSNNVLANDIVATEIMKLDKQKIKHLNYAIQSEIGPSSLEDIDIKGLNLDYFKDVVFESPNPDLVARLMFLIFNSRRLTKFFFISPIFYGLNELAWKYRNFFGKKRRVYLDKT